jgi:hypothetical protein
MARDDWQPGCGEYRERGSLYQEVTDRIIAELEAGRVPWVQPWGQGKAALGLPRNAATGRRYSGVNILILWGAVIERGWPSQDWLTFRQALVTLRDRLALRLAAPMAPRVPINSDLPGVVIAQVTELHLGLRGFAAAGLACAADRSYAS